MPFESYQINFGSFSTFLKKVLIDPMVEIPSVLFLSRSNFCVNMGLLFYFSQK